MATGHRPTPFVLVFRLQDLMDSDALLDADDLKKPDPDSLKAPTCGEGAKKKKACKNWYEACMSFLLNVYAFHKNT